MSGSPLDWLSGLFSTSEDKKQEKTFWEGASHPVTAATKQSAGNMWAERPNPPLNEKVEDITGFGLPEIAIKVQAAPAREEGTPPNSLTIDYSYDPLNRLTAADYDSGLYFHYQYDAVGNRLEETKVVNPLMPEVVKIYTYDDANRIATINGANYTWDDNGNLLNDGVYTYIYNHANQLAAVSNSGLTVGYTYNVIGSASLRTA